MRKVAAITLVVLLTFCTFGCSENSTPEETEKTPEKTTIVARGYAYEIYPEWESEIPDVSQVFFYPLGKSNKRLSELHIVDFAIDTPLSTKEEQVAYLEAAFPTEEELANGTYTWAYDNIELVDFGETACITADVSTSEREGARRGKILRFFIDETKMTEVTFLVAEERYDAAASDIEETMSTFRLS